MKRLKVIIVGKENSGKTTLVQKIPNPNKIISHGISDPNISGERKKDDSMFISTETITPDSKSEIQLWVYLFSLL